MRLLFDFNYLPDNHWKEVAGISHPFCLENFPKGFFHDKMAKSSVASKDDYEFLVKNKGIEQNSMP